MFGENASFIKSVEIDDSVFQCELDCSEKYLLQLERSTDNETWQWKVIKKSDVLWNSTSNWGKTMMATNNDKSGDVIKELQDTITELNNRIVTLEVEKENVEAAKENVEAEKKEAKSDEDEEK